MYRYLTSRISHLKTTPTSCLIPRQKLSTTTQSNGFNTSSVGIAGTEGFRLYFNDKQGNVISPWHEIPLKTGDFYNFINEIPKFTKMKMEIATKEPSNPIAQDKKQGKLREYHGPIYWNYGCLPQTWEDPHVLHPELKCKGDNDPIDVVEIGSKSLITGSIIQVKVLGAFALMDDGELDWKIVAINKDDDMASLCHDITDVDKHMPHTLSGIREWFRWYKSPDKRTLNKFGFNDKALSREVAIQAIEETHHHYLRLKQGQVDRGSLSLS